MSATWGSAGSPCGSWKPPWYAVVGLRVLSGPRGDLVGVDEEVVAVDPRLEPVEPLAVVVARDAGAEHVVPTVEPADEVVALHPAVRHQGTPVQTAAVEHRLVVVEAHDHEVDTADERTDGLAVRQGAPGRDPHWLHGPPHCSGGVAPV